MFFRHEGLGKDLWIADEPVKEGRKFVSVPMSEPRGFKGKDQYFVIAGFGSPRRAAIMHPALMRLDNTKYPKDKSHDDDHGMA